MEKRVNHEGCICLYYLLLGVIDTLMLLLFLTLFVLLIFLISALSVCCICLDLRSNPCLCSVWKALLTDTLSFPWDALRINVTLHQDTK